jgi:hypothetical protein
MIGVIGKATSAVNKLMLLAPDPNTSEGLKINQSRSSDCNTASALALLVKYSVSALSSAPNAEICTTFLSAFGRKL